jgi:pimeloyl-ACP methyl ester carboxylesterase
MRAALEDDAGDPVAALLPGSGSSGDFIRRAFGPPLAAAGYRLVAPEPRPGADVVAAATAALAETVRRHRVRLVGGVSLGAHVAATWAAAGAAGVDGLLLALPAWTGPPGPAAAAARVAASAVQRHGTAAALQVASAAGGTRWVVDELAAAWPRYGVDLADTLRAAAAAPGPDRDELRRISLPVGLVGFRDDPMHPAEVTEEWAGLLPRCAVEWLDLADLATDRSRLGAAALRAWHRASAG